ncbi:serine/threonine-protein kinase [Kitasatospora sp. NPDC001603]|uniref:serine/threonine-protein kinase n=1 Tax=Kitasatospora sp. NPDC001603 TaxID=3154388 RepID=UPI0033248075
MESYTETPLGLIILVLGGVALVVRMVSLPLLMGAQQATRHRAIGRLAGPGGRVAVPSGLTAAAVGEQVLVLLSAAGLLALLNSTIADTDFVYMMPSIVSESPLAIAKALDVHFSITQPIYLIPAVVALLGWVFLWLLTQRNLLVVGMPPGAGTTTGSIVRLIGGFVLRAVLGALVLPIGVVEGALMFQIIALVTSRRPLAGGAGRTAHVPPDAPPAARPASHLPMPAAPVDAPWSVPAPPAPQFAPAPLHLGRVEPARQAGQASPASPVGHVPHQALYPHEPRTIGGYQLLGRIGAGGMGTVYLARREGSATQVALKTINPELLGEADLLRRFEREAEVLAMVSGAYTARVLDAGVDSGRPYLAMELLDGRPLDVHLREQGPIRSPEALRALALALALALRGVHRLGLVHRDLKPANIMLTTAGPRLLDFGIAAIVDGTRLTRTGGGPGTLTYMAPEQFGDGPVGPAADVWAWACCVVCAAHGGSPFAAASTGAVIRRIVDTGPEPTALAALAALDPALAAVVGRALTADPQTRPGDGGALLDLLTTRHGPGGTEPDAGALREEITHGWRTLALRADQDFPRQ